MPLSMRPSEGRLTTRRLTELALCTALIFVLQVVMGPLANIELVSLLIILYTRWFGRQTLLVIYLFALLEGVFYGFHVWWIMYLYVWTILWLLATLLNRREAPLLAWALLSGGFGLAFGLLCAGPYWITGGIGTAVAWWISGIPFDLIHGVANFVLVLVLFRPLDRLYQHIRSGI